MSTETVTRTRQLSTSGSKKMSNTGPLSKEVLRLLEQEEKYTVGGFAPCPAFFVSGKGSTLMDVDGKEYIDFIAMFSAANLGQCHPKMVEAMIESMKKITLLNVSTHNATWPDFAEMLCKRFGYDKVNAMVTGAEGADAACKIARKWGTKVKGIPSEEVLVLGVSDNYHGLSSGVWPLMNPDQSRVDYACHNKTMININPKTGELLRYGYTEDMEKCLEENHAKVAAVIMECIHGRLETFEQERDFARAVRLLCKKYNILFISDETRMGAGKTGKFFCWEWLGEDCRPDIICMGKSITGGAYPASFVVGDNETMSLVKTYESASTFAMTPPVVAAATAALKIIDDEKLLDRALDIKKKWEDETASWNYPFVQYITSRGADLNVTLKADYPNKSVTARRIAALAMHRGLLTYPLEGRVRMSVALTISDAELYKGFSILKSALDDIESYDEISGGEHAGDH